MSVSAPISRIPLGEQIRHHRPSLLDYCAASRGSLQYAYLDWLGAHNDHCFSVAEVKLDRALPETPKSTWHCIDPYAAVAWVHANSPESAIGVDAVILLVEELMEVHSDVRPSKQRRVPKPDGLQQLYHRIANTSDHSTKLHLHREACKLKHQWYRSLRGSQFNDNFKLGKAASRHSKLHTIQAIGTSAADGNHFTYNRANWQDILGNEFSRRWLAGHFHRLSVISDLRNKYAAISPTFDGAQIMAVLDQLKPSKRIDSMGLCTLACRVFGVARPDLLAAAVTYLVASADALRDINVVGNVKGKKSAKTLAKDVRAILPFPTLLEIADCLIAKHLNNFIDRMFEPIFGVYVGATRGTQCAEITTSLQLAVEKGLDQRSQVAIADSDIAQFYDNLCPILLTRWLGKNGYEPEYIGAIIRLITLPTTSLRTGGCVVPLRPRTRGVFTGSRLANALGRIPVLDTIRSVFPIILPNAFITPSGGLLVSCWVDNLISVAPSASKAVATLQTIEHYLDIHWGLHLKAGSTRYLSAHPQDLVNNPKWHRVHTLDLLGDIITDNCSTAEPFKIASRLCWSAFFAKLSHEGYRTLSGPLKAVQIDKFILPVLRSRWTGWPFGKVMAQKIDALQNRMIGALLDVHMQPAEDLPDYIRRRAHLASAFSAGQGAWSTRWAADIKNWDVHCRRNTSSAIWTNALLKLGAPSELIRRRAQFALSSRSWTCFAGRTDTRRAPGYVPIRREDSIDAATEYLLQTATSSVLRRLRLNR